jgi:hypothetical protein
MGSFLLVVCLVALGTSGCILFALFGPLPPPRRKLVIPRTLPEPMTLTPATPETWIEGPTFTEDEESVHSIEIQPIVQPILRRPRFELRTAPVRAFEFEDATQFDPR